MKKTLFLLLIIPIFFTSCSKKETTNVNQNTTSVIEEKENTKKEAPSIETPSINKNKEKISEIQQISKETSIPTFHEAQENTLTINMQKDFINKTFLFESQCWEYDIFEINNKKYLKAQTYQGILYMEITDEQINDFSEYDLQNIIYSATIKKVYPLNAYLKPELDIFGSFNELSDTSEIRDYVAAYTEVDVRYNIFYGKIDKVYSIHQFKISSDS